MELEQEIDALQLERASIRPGIPVVMMIVGGVSASVLLFPGILLLAAGEVCDDGWSGGERSCTNLRGAGAIMTLAGAAGSVVGLVGVVMLVNQAADKRELDQRIAEKQRELKGLDLGFAAGPHHAGLRLSLTL